MTGAVTRFRHGVLLLLPLAGAMAEESEKLERIEVDARTAPSPSTLETGGSNVILNADELRGVAGNQGDPLTAVSTLPGVVGNTGAGSGGGGGLGAGFFIRGSDTGDNLFRVDGLPVGYLFHLGGATSVLNPDTVERFSTWLAGYPAEFGDRLGGVVDVALRAPRDDRLHQSYQIGFYESSALIEGPTGEDSSGFLAFRRSYVDLLLPGSGSLGDGDSEYTTFPRFHDVQGRWRRELEDGFVEFSLFSARDELAFLFGDDVAERDPALRGALGSDQSFTTLGTRWVQDLSPDWEQTVRFGRLEERFDFFFGNQAETGEPFFLDLHTTTDFLSPQWRRYGDSLWTTGVDLERRRSAIEADAPLQPSEQGGETTLSEQSSYAVDDTLRYDEATPYAEWEPPPLGALQPRLGLRYSHQTLRGADVTLSGWSPRSEWRYDLTPDTALVAQWGLYRQAPGANQRVPGAGNPDLGWTLAEHRVLGIKHAMRGPWSLQVEAYHKPMTELVLERREQDPPDNYINAVDGEAYGLDLLARRESADGRMGWLGYSYGRSFRADRGPDRERRPFSSDQPHTVQAVWSQPFREGGEWRWGARLNAHSGRPYTAIVGVDEKTNDDGETYYVPVEGKNNGERLPPFVRLDLRAERSFRYGWGELSAIFELLNVTQPLRPNVVGYSYDEDYANYDDPDAVSGFPFLPSFSVRATF
ncbi:MAG: TonB-dependent receptor plug domain-containing protein [Pseudomonadota bacterium]